MENQKLFLYVGLVLLGWLLYQQWQFDYGPQPAAPQTSENRPAETAADDRPANDIPSLTADSADLPVTDSADFVESPEARPERYVEVITDRLRVLIDTHGAAVVQADLLTYPVAVDQLQQPFELLSPEKNHYFVAQSGLLAAAGAPAPTHHDVFRVAQQAYRLEAGQETLTVPLVWETDGVRVVKSFVFKRDSYLIELNYRLENSRADAWRGRQYAQLQRKAVTDDEKSRLIYTFIGGVILDEERKYEKIDFDDFRGMPERDITGSWAAIIQHYFLAAWVPEKDSTFAYYTRVLTETMPNRYILGFKGPLHTIAAGETGEFHNRLYVGPKDQDRLKQIADKLHLTVDYGMLTVIAEPLFWLLRKIHEYVGNWGWSIVLLTILIKLVFYKLTEGQYRSMARMRKLQPKMLALKERYGDDRQKLGQATMDLYKKEKVNPLGGCLPMLVQIPVFIALYWVLLESVELRQASFMLWIEDLSVRDPYYILPLIMGVTMFIQQKLNPAPIDPIQAKVFMAMPFVFTVFFAFFPAGLVLYWLVNNVLSIAQQWYITHHVIKDTK